MAVKEIELEQIHQLFDKKVQIKLPKKIEIKDGYLTSEKEYITLATLCSLQQPKKIFEIGTFEGYSTLVLAMNAPKAEIFTLNLPKNNKKTKFEVGDWNKKYIDHKGELKFVGTPQEKQIVQLFGDSASFDFSKYYGKIDFIFVDGSHTYEYTENDTEKAFEMAGKNSLIVWHDYSSPAWPDTNRFLNELAKTKELYHIKDTYLLFWKL